MDCTIFAREYAKKACGSEANIFGERFFDQHLELVAHYAGLLAEKLGADREVSETAAYLHDCAAIFTPERMSEHALLGGDFVYSLLKDNGCDDTFAKRVADCVRTHSAPLNPGEGTIEQVCVSNADAMTQIARPVFWLHYSFCVKENPFTEGSAWLRGWITGSWNRMIPEARELVAAEYEIAQLILSAALVG